jgi:hypothetical protein
MRGAAALAGDLALSLRVHGREAAVRRAAALTTALAAAALFTLT